MIPLTILIVEDDANVRSLLWELIEPYAQAVVESADGRDAVRQYAEHRPDLVLMDIRMPVMDGLEATRRITALDPAARIFIVTEHDERLYGDRAIEAGAAGFFMKDNLLALQRYISALQAAGGNGSARKQE